jgi:5-methylcytosine-specific restriction endonuclease McrA
VATQTYQAEYREQNREVLREYHRARYRQFKSSYIERNQRREKRTAQASFPHQREILSQFYRDCPEGQQVDHVIPLRHPLVCGLHAIANLQYLTGPDNLKKGNKWEPDW